MRADLGRPASQVPARPPRMALAALAAMAMAGGCNPVLGPSKTDANWRVHESVRFSLHVRPGSFAESNAAAIGEALDHQYDATLSALAAQFDRRVTAFLFDSGRDAGLASDYSGVGYPETLTFRATAVAPLNENLHSLLGHEANHVIIMGALGRAGTQMVNEGLASAVLSGQYAVGPGYYHGWTNAHRAQIPPLARLADDDEWEKADSQIAYPASASFLAYLLETRGATPLRAIYYAGSGEFVARVQSVYGKSLTDLEAEWLAFCERYAR